MWIWKIIARKIYNYLALVFPLVHLIHALIPFMESTACILKLISPELLLLLPPLIVDIAALQLIGSFLLEELNGTRLVLSSLWVLESIWVTEIFQFLIRDPVEIIAGAEDSDLFGLEVFEDVPVWVDDKRVNEA